MTDAAIEVRGLRKTFGPVVAVDHVDLTVRAGECVGLLGPNGAGKTTTVEILEGLQPPTGGTVRVLGRSWERDAAEIRERLGVQLQETRLYERLTVRETVTLFRSFYRRGLSVDEAIDAVAIREKEKAQVGKLSGGQKQRLALALALVADPELLFLDEPTTGLDPVSRRGIWDAVERLKEKRRTVVLTTHYMEEAARLCDRVVIVDRGRVVADGTPASLIASLGGEQVIELRTGAPIPEDRLRSARGVRGVRGRPDGALLSVERIHQALPEVLEACRAAGVEIVELSTRQASLDDVFLALTGRKLEEAS